MKIELGRFSLGETHEILSTVIVPLPIALVSTVSRKGIYNAAPYSLVFPVCWKPPTVCLSIGRKKGVKKDTLRNIEATRDFVLNIMSEDYLRPLVQASKEYPYEMDETKEVGLTPLPAEKVRSPRIAEAAASLECRVVRRMKWSEEEGRRDFIFGEVVLLHVRDELWNGDRADVAKMKAVGRMGNGVYCRTGDIFSLKPS